MSNRRGHHWLTRATSVAVTALYLVAVSRTMIPGLCATQNAIEERAATCCVSALGGCDTETDRVANTVEHIECGFCHMAKAPNTPTPYGVEFDAPEAIADHTPEAVERIAALDIDGISAPRAPPLSLA